MSHFTAFYVQHANCITAIYRPPEGLQGGRVWSPFGGSADSGGMEGERVADLQRFWRCPSADTRCQSPETLLALGKVTEMVSGLDFGKFIQQRPLETYD